MRQKIKISRGFTLIEVMIAMALSLLVMGTAVSLYKQAVQVSSLVAQRSTVQDNSRAGINSISADLTQAGSGLPDSGVALPSTAKFACSASACGLYNYPVNGTTRTLYGVMPGNALGPQINGGSATDVVTTVYTDREPDLESPGLVCPVGSTGGFDAYPLAGVTLSPLTITFNSATCPVPADPGYGFQTGDLVLISNLNGTVVQYVTSVSGNQLTLGSDSFGLNVTGTGSGSLGSLFSGQTLPPSGSSPSTVAIKLNVITYSLMVPNLGTASQLPPRLMRQVNGLPPQPVAEQVNDFRITYDVIDPTLGNANANPPVLPLSGGQVNPTTLVNIRKINVKLVGVGGLSTPGVQSQQVALTTAVSPRSLSFYDRYPSSGGTSQF